MVDLFVLAKLSKPLTIGEQDYIVTWDTELNRARIITDDLQDLNDNNGNEMTFGTELDAHRYLMGLKLEMDGPTDSTWMTMD